MNLFLTFSDAAKFADVARNFVLGRGWGSSFSFLNPYVFEQIRNPLFRNSGILPIHSLFIALFFKILGISDFSVVATSFFFYLLSLFFVFLLGRKIFKSNFVGFLSVLAVGFNLNLIDYATSGASESLFIAEIILAFYLLSFRNKVFDFFSLLVLILMYFTRPHAFIYIAGAILFWLLLRFKVKKALLYFFLFILSAIFVDFFLVSHLSGKFFVYSIFQRAERVVLRHSPMWAVSDALRGISSQKFDYLAFFKKVFYHLYNFYKLLPNILNPYLFVFFLLSFFEREKSLVEKSFKKTTYFVFLFVFLVAAATIPFYRYIHPVLPLVYVVSIGEIKKNLERFDIEKKSLFLISFFLVLFFAVLPSIGVLVLDKRFEKKIFNFSKPPVYVKLSYILKENTNEKDLVLTNLDTWGSWYGERRTVWFPLEPKMIIDPGSQKIPFDAIYLTSYKMDDENYYMGKSWRTIFENPDDPVKWACEGCEKIREEFIVKGVYKIEKDEVFENQEHQALLLIHR